MFKKILVANRGEIAVRVISTCKEMHIPVVAVYSDADAASRHRLIADESYPVGKSEPSDSYLNIEKIISTAKKAGADAIHPGYGFLAENADFAKACEDHGITFIGPPSDVIRNLGDKTKARRIMETGNVPVIPGMSHAADNLDAMSDRGDAIGWPVLIKAAAGGGGKGMRVVRSKHEMADACAAASREAESAFGDRSVYLEKYISPARHIEFQILADQYGHVVHLFERECSIQRRHQKIIEESPSYALTPDLRERMGKAAVAAAQASGYVNAGTVEFLLGPDETFYFLEVNTRLQVEHPVTEMVAAIDLVQKQIEIAAGRTLSLSQQDLSSKGHAIECRIYGEDPEKSFFPSSGKIEFLQEPTGPGIRCDSGIYAGAAVPVDYDPILSKLVVHAETRESAINRMIKALSEYVILGIKTNVNFLMDILGSDVFRSGRTCTNLIESHFPDWTPACPDADMACLAFIAADLSPGVTSSVVPDDRFPEPWKTLGNWRIS